MKKALVCLAIVGLFMFGAFATETIRFVNIPSGDMDSDIVAFAPILQFVEDYVNDAGFDIEFESIVVLDYSAAIQAMIHGHAEMSRFGPAQYLLLQKESDFGFTPLARDIKGKTGLPFYNTLFIARADTGIPGLCSCLVKDYTMAFVDETSTSGYLVPLVELLALGLSPDSFSEVYWAGSHAASIQAVWDGHVDIAVTNEYRYGLAIDEGVIVESEMQVLLVSAPIPTNPIIASNSLGKDLLAVLGEAWLAVPADIAGGFGLGGFALAVDADYDSVRALEAIRD